MIKSKVTPGLKGPGGQLGTPLLGGVIFIGLRFLAVLLHMAGLATFKASPEDTDEAINWDEPDTDRALGPPLDLGGG